MKTHANTFWQGFLKSHWLTGEPLHKTIPTVKFYSFSHHIWMCDRIQSNLHYDLQVQANVRKQLLMHQELNLDQLRAWSLP